MAINIHQYYSEVFEERVSGRAYQKKSMRTPMAIPVMAGVFLLSMVLFYVWQRAQVVNLGYQIEILQAEKKALQKRNREVFIEVSGLTSPDRIERLASSKVGLAAPNREQIVIVKRMPPLVPRQNPEREHDVASRFTNFLFGNRS